MDRRHSRWLRDTLVLDNQIFLERDPDAVAGKFAKMGSDPYLFFRGTAPQYARDFTEPDSPGNFSSAYRSAATRDVALVGRQCDRWRLGTPTRFGGWLAMTRRAPS